MLNWLKVGSKIKSKTSKPSYKYLAKKSHPQFTEILNLILSLNSNKALGHDSIPAYILKFSRYIVTPYFKFFTDSIFNNGEFSSNCKIAKIVLIFKNGYKEETNNYRPILILTCFSKIIEKMLYCIIV